MLAFNSDSLEKLLQNLLISDVTEQRCWSTYVRELRAGVDTADAYDAWSEAVTQARTAIVQIGDTLSVARLKTQKRSHKRARRVQRMSAVPGASPDNALITAALKIAESALISKARIQARLTAIKSGNLVIEPGHLMPIA